ncbi:MAG: SHOCT domain-containing protein [Desulfobacterales bacterium]
MNTISKKLSINVNKIMVFTVAITICFTMVPGFKIEARADKGAAFLGGMVAGHVIGGAVRRDRIRTAAAVEMANQPRTVQQAAPAPAPAPAAKPTAQQRLDQLDKLAAGGYITPEEYKAKKKAILDSM